MEKVEKETHDFMNVESFSQLPFIRPAPVKEKGIRLFGKEFGGGDSASSGVAADESDSVETNARVDETKESENGESSRKFECHYCCRNFPTSQALGGHQNAHKRERQHAKRAHLQSAMVHGAYPEAHVYGIVNYHRFGAAPTHSMGHHNSWNPISTNNNVSGYSAIYNNNNNNNNSSRFSYGSGNGHGSYSHQQTPINGSPLAMWRIPSVHNSAAHATFNHDRSGAAVPLFGNDHHEVKGRIMGNASHDAQNRYVYDTKPSSASVKEHVSLDLHL